VLGAADSYCSRARLTLYRGRMARNTDARGRLIDDPFSYTVAKSGTMSISRGGRLVVTVSADAAAQLSKKLDATDEAGAQLLLAKATGNYKRGNERR
jgi:hypothetical protein